MFTHISPCGFAAPTKPRAALLGRVLPWRARAGSSGVDITTQLRCLHPGVQRHTRCTRLPVTADLGASVLHELSTEISLVKRLVLTAKEALTQLTGQPPDRWKLQGLFTLTGNAGTLLVLGNVYETGGEREAMLCFVASPDDSSPSGVLDGLSLHWGCSEKAASRWLPPPHGWHTFPDRSYDAGHGAWRSPFAKLDTQEPMYLATLQIPATGPLKRGGISFVLKTIQGDSYHWIKDAATSSDMFVPLHQPGKDRGGAASQALHSTDPGGGGGGGGELDPATSAALEAVRRVLGEVPGRVVPQERAAAGGNGEAAAAAPAASPHSSNGNGNGTSGEQRQQQQRPNAGPAAASHQGGRAEDPEPEGARIAFGVRPSEVEKLLGEVAVRPASSRQYSGGRAQHAGEDVCAWMVDRIKDSEHGAERSLMHRFNVAKGLVDSAMSSTEPEAALLAVAVWLRYSAARHLTWNRNYNIKPREISAAQSALANTLTDITQMRPDLRDVALLALASVGRGGEGELGQRIRDEILVVQSRNGTKGGMMEEWHQKLHNNTSPDDVVICEALIAYIESGLDISRYWAVLQQSNITRERLGSYERRISNEPRFSPEQSPGLLADLKKYLVTLKAVHSGADLQAAANSVIGYKQPGVRGGQGREIDVAEVPGVATKRLRVLLAAALQLQQQKQHEKDAAGATQLLRLLVEARVEIQPALQGGNSACGGRLKDVVFLDLALDAAARGVMEGAMAQVRGASLGTTVALLAAALENSVITTGSGELAACLRQLEQLALDAGSAEPRTRSLQLLAVLDRASRCVADLSMGLGRRLQPTAQALGEKLGLQGSAVDMFSEEVVRGSSSAALVQVIAALQPKLRQLAEVGDWQVISRGSGAAAGKLLVMDNLAAVQHEVYAEPVVLLVDVVRGEEEVPEGCVALISRDCPDVLCHSAVRARNSGVLFASCLDAERLRELQGLAGKSVEVALLPGDQIRVRLAADLIKAAPAPAGAAAPEAAPPAILQLQAPRWCGRWVLPLENFSAGIVGGKSLNTLALQGSLPPGVLQPPSVAVPFGVFEEVLQAPENMAVAAAVRALEQEAGRKPEVLAKLRRTVMWLEAPAALRFQLLRALQDGGLPQVSQHCWEGLWLALRKVWASKWNERAAISLRKAGLPLDYVRMAVLVQAAVPVQYAFVAHTTNPSSGDSNEVLIDMVRGLGETLVGSHPGRSFSVQVSKDKLKAAIGDETDPVLWETEALTGALRVLSYPSKTTALLLPGALREGVAIKNGGPVMMVRSDSNCEDLPGFAGAGLFDSWPTSEPIEVTAEYGDDPLLVEPVFQSHLVARIAATCCQIEQHLGGPQDIEGGVTAEGTLYIVQARPQV